MIELSELIELKLSNLKRAQEAAKRERESATMDSRSDQIGFIADQLHAAYDREIQDLIKIKNQLGNPLKFTDSVSLNCLVTIRSMESETTYLLVPPSLGGLRVDSVLLLSVEAPLAKLLLNRTVGYSFQFNGQCNQIIAIQPNL